MNLDRSRGMRRRQQLLLWVAQGFGTGRARFAPGTFGSLVGFGWALVLFSTHDLVLFLVGAVLGIAASVWICGEAEKILNQTDPGSVVFDEIAAIPICFLGWIARCLWSGREFFDLFRQNEVFWLIPTVFLLFRCFDILKPWPVRQSQMLPAGWGVTMDDLLAALYVSLATLGISSLVIRAD
jgi:phosphatidylglycerophosphatase A